MIDLHNEFEPLDDLELLVRSAKDYVCASDELRPRVLEAARSHWAERRALGYLRHVAAIILLLVMLSPALRRRLEAVGNGKSGVLATVSAEELLSTAETAIDSTWGLVDSFTELRRRQAELLRPAAELPRRKV